MFNHQRLTVYHRACELQLSADSFVTLLPRGRAYLVDQLRRASSSITTNIAEGAGEFCKPDKARFYRLALRSASECASLIEQCERLGLVGDDVAHPRLALVAEVVAMLTTMVRHLVEGQEIGD
jgi:four helix bundle protein